jgi:hypothetical protein
MNNGVLLVKGNFTQRQLDAIGRIWNSMQTNEKTGILPIIQLGQDTAIVNIYLDDSGKLQSKKII